MRKLRIATFVTSHFTIPGPKGIIYAPLDVASELCSGLVGRGHKVDFFAPRGSRVKGCKVVDLGMPPLKQKFDSLFDGGSMDESTRYKMYNLWDQYFLSEIYKRAAEGRYDIIHIHPVDRALPFAKIFPSIPTVYTLHDPMESWRKKFFELYKSKKQHFVSISDAQRKPAPNLGYAATIYNGIDTNLFKFSETHEDYLFFVGRLIKQKGVHEAIQTARRTNSRLLIAGAPASGDYWNKKIKPYIGGKIKYVGNVPRTELPKYYRGAKATLFPIRWEEPFGLVMTESMSCGTPVIAFNRGSVPEIVKSGKTGFIAKNTKEMTAAVKKIDRIDRRMCRAWIEKNFSTEKMTDGYENLFLKISK